MAVDWVETVSQKLLVPQFKNPLVYEGDTGDYFKNRDLRYSSVYE